MPWQEESELELLIQQGEDELGDVALEELSLCHEEIERLKASLVNAVIPQDEADQHSAVLELRTGMPSTEMIGICTEISEGTSL